MAVSRKYVLQAQFEGEPKPSDMTIVEETLRPLKDGEFLTEAIYLSVDPYMRAYAHRVSVGSTFHGAQVARVIESKNGKYAVGTHVVIKCGWRTHAICDGDAFSDAFPTAWVVPDLNGLPLSLALGVLGMPGNTAYFGFLELCEPKSGETVVVTGAGGAVGSLVGQIAKIIGCRVIGIAGSDDKGKWLLDELKFDHFINYKDKDFKRQLELAAPDGVDCYFDNVGGEISTSIIHAMNPFGRISVCGAISGYCNDNIMTAGAVQYALLSKQLKMEGFIVSRWKHRWFEGIVQIKEWILQGKLQCRETVTEGFENMFQAFIDMLQGRNVGKAIVKV